MILRWCDASTHFHGTKAYNKGDIIPEYIFQPNVLRMLLHYGKVEYIETLRLPKIKLSISIMAHPSRSHYFDRLKEKLGDVPFSIDQNNNLIENCKAAWRSHDPSADFHVVIQDDAIVCNNFKERAEKFITDMESERVANNWPINLYNFFFKQDCSSTIMYEYEKKGYMFEARNRGGVAICLPVNQIENMIKHYDTLTDRHDDERINDWLVSNKYKACFSVPSLIDHDDHTPSLAGNRFNNRQAYKFIDNIKNIIPKQIHQLWIGDKPAPTKWMQTWKDKNPGWLYRLWTEKEMLAENWVNQRHIDFYYKRKMWHGVADVARYEILYNYGGAFFDADAECLLPVDELFNDNREGYSCYENEKARLGLICPLMAAPKDSKFALELIEGLQKLDEVGEPWKTTGNRYMQKMVEKTARDVKIFPSHYFIPEHFTGEKYTGTDKIYSTHHWGTTLENYKSGI